MIYSDFFDILVNSVNVFVAHNFANFKYFLFYDKGDSEIALWHEGWDNYLFKKTSNIKRSFPTDVKGKIPLPRV